MRKSFYVWIVWGLIFGGCGERELKVMKVEPAKIPAGEAMMLKVSGQGFAEGAKVWLGGMECPQVVVVSSRELIALSPRKLEAGTKEVKVELKDGKSSLLVSGLVVEAVVKVVEVSPTMVPEGAASQEIRVRGEGFQPGAKVFFGDQPAAKVEVKDQTSLTAWTPSLVAGTKDVMVENPDGSRGTLFDRFQVIAASGAATLLPLKEEAEKWGLPAGKQMENGIAIADVNRDGFLDFFVTGSNAVTLALGSAEGKFKEVTDSGITFTGIRYGGVFGDFDQDGLPDLLLSGHPPLLFHNLGGAKFEDVSERVGLRKDVKNWAAVWLDYDADGLLDLFLGELSGNDLLLHNVGGRFEEAQKEVVAKKEIAAKINNREPTTFSAAGGDYDRDGFPDLFVGIRGQPSALLHNEKGRLKNVIESMGVPTFVAGSNPTTYYLDWGVLWADFDNDGWLDLFSSSGPLGGKLFRNREGKALVDVTQNFQTLLSRSPLAPAAGDLDNDGWVDLALSDNLSGFRIYRNQGDGSFKDVSEELGLPATMVTGAMALTWLDLNRDGALDLYVVEFMNRDRLYVGTPFPGRHFLEVELTGAKSNSMAIGAMVMLEAGHTVMVRQVSGGEGYLSQPPGLLHFGLGKIEKVDKLTVIWPGGEKQVLEQVKVDQVLSITQPGERKPVALPPPQSAPTSQPGATTKPAPPPPPPKQPTAPPTPQPGATPPAPPK